MHPTNEEWMSYLYDELASGEQGRLKTHLESCPDCQARVANWRATMRDLNTWELPAQSPKRAASWEYVKWGVAAMLMLCLGYGFARATTPAAPDLAAIRAALEPEIRRQAGQAAAAAVATSNAETQRLVAELTKHVEAKQEEDRLAVADILESLEAKRINDLANLRKELETVAVNAEDRLDNAHEQIVQLASISQPRGSLPVTAEGQK